MKRFTIYIFTSKQITPGSMCNQQRDGFMLAWSKYSQQVVCLSWLFRVSIWMHLNSLRVLCRELIQLKTCSSALLWKLDSFTWLTQLLWGIYPCFRVLKSGWCHLCCLWEYGMCENIQGCEELKCYSCVLNSRLENHTLACKIQVILV